MHRSLTEQKILKQLDIPDFRHMTKDKIIEFTSLLPQMNPEVAKKALDQFPDFANSAVKIVDTLKNVAADSLGKSDESSKRFDKMANRVMDSLQEMLKDGPLSFDEKQYIIDQMMQLSKMVDDHDTKQKSFIFKLFGLLSTVFMAIIAVIGTTIGFKGNGKFLDR